MTTAQKTTKKVLGIHPAPPMHWVGDGFPVRTMFSYDDDSTSFSPFLLLDYAAPAEFPPSDIPRGVGEHPHRGFETVTIAYQGEIEHRDSAGNKGKIGPGDVQWMTAASGIVHEEMHGRQFVQKGGTLEMVQLWVNLPARFKMSQPRYQDILDGQIPSVHLANGGGTVRVIAGEFQGAKGPARTFTPVNLWDARIKAGHPTEIRVPQGQTTLLLVLRGEVAFDGSHSAGEGDLVRLDRHGDAIPVEARKDATILVLTGEPIAEPVVGYGPFVMNTKDEIRQAIEDYNGGRMGHLK